MSALSELAKGMRANSERWFPRWHDGSLGIPLWLGYSIGLGGEGGEQLNAAKKIIRDGPSPERSAALATELADVFVYLLLLADELGIDLIEEYEAKVVVNNARWAS